MTHGTRAGTRAPARLAPAVPAGLLVACRDGVGRLRDPLGIRLVDVGVTATRRITAGPQLGSVRVVVLTTFDDEIAARLVVSPLTVKTHLSRAMTKLAARDRAQLVVIAYSSGLADPGIR